MPEIIARNSPSAPSNIDESNNPEMGPEESSTANSTPVPPDPSGGAGVSNFLEGMGDAAEMLSRRGNVARAARGKQNIESNNPEMGPKESSTANWTPASPNVKNESQDRTNLRQAALDAYKGNVTYHGTTAEGKNSIQGSGFDITRKAGGAFAAKEQSFQQKRGYEKMKSNTQRHNYLSTDKGIAKQFARIAASGVKGQPALVRTLGAGSDFSVEKDPDASKYNPNHPLAVHTLRTASNIPPDFVLGSKKSSPSADAQPFQRALTRAGVSVSLDEAGEMLRDVQSDSDEDF